MTSNARSTECSGGFCRRESGLRDLSLFDNIMTCCRDRERASVRQLLGLCAACGGWGLATVAVPGGAAGLITIRGHELGVDGHGHTECDALHFANTQHAIPHGVPHALDTVAGGSVNTVSKGVTDSDPDPTSHVSHLGEVELH